MSSEFVKEIREELALEAEQNPIPTKPVKEIPETRCYTVPDLQIILNISRGSVYELLQRKASKRRAKRQKQSAKGQAMMQSWRLKTSKKMSSMRNHRNRY